MDMGVQYYSLLIYWIFTQLSDMSDVLEFKVSRKAELKISRFRISFCYVNAIDAYDKDGPTGNAVEASLRIVSFPNLNVSSIVTG